MIATLLDTVTGEKFTTDDKHDSFSWAEGNWSCDCNRGSFFNIDDESNRCNGGKRFLVVAAEFSNKETEEGYIYTLRELNECYHVELLDKHLPSN
jgi:hypothetical protein